MTAPVIDMHSHFFPESWPDLDKMFGGDPWPWIKHTGPGKAMIMIGDTEFRPIHDACWSVERRLEDMDRHGLDKQVICATPVLFAYARPADQAADVARIFNDATLEMCGRSGGRLLPLCQVPLQDIDRSCEVLSEAMKAGHLGVQIGNHVELTHLDDEGIVTFLQHCADEGAAVLVHPWDMMARERMPNYMMGWTVGMPAETQLGIVSMILGGAFDRLPRSLRICFAHGGGSFAFLLGRLENAWHHRDIARGKSQHPPSHYCDRFMVDTAVFSHEALELLVKVMGTERILLGSDYPFPLGEMEIGNLVRTAPFLDDMAKSAMLGGNAARWLGLDDAAASRAAE